MSVWIGHRCTCVPWNLIPLPPPPPSPPCTGLSLYTGFGWPASCIELASGRQFYIWSPHAKSWLIGKDSDVGRDWGQEEKGTTEDEMAGWHHQLDGREFEWTQGDGDGQGGLACCSSWGRKESDMTEQLNWTYIFQCYSLKSPHPQIGIIF